MVKILSKKNLIFYITKKKEKKKEVLSENFVHKSLQKIYFQKIYKTINFSTKLINFS